MITQSEIIYISGVSLAGLAALAYLNRQQSPPPATTALPIRFTSENITQRFTASLPEICPVLNLELAVCKQVETFIQTSERRAFCGWLNLGMNVAQITVPVTYRYHIHVRDAWKLETIGNRVVVHAPVLRPALPPAIDTSELQRFERRGWCRWSPTELMADLERQITPTLVAYANDPRRLNLVRDTCRKSAAEFVRLWLEREGQWGKTGFTQIQVKFADEPALPPTTTLRLLS